MQAAIDWQQSNLTGPPRADTAVWASSACFNFGLAGVYEKWGRDWRDAQDVDGWLADHAVGVARVGWQHYADRRVMADQLDSGARWVEFVRKNNPDLIWRKERGADPGDPGNADEISREGWPAKGAAAPKDLLATARFAYATRRLAMMARAAGRGEMAAKYSLLADQIKEAFVKEFARPDGSMVGDTQAGYAIALEYDLLPENLRPGAADRLAEGVEKYKKHLSTGTMTTGAALRQLSRWGRHDLALAAVRDTPVFSAIGEWLWRDVLGLNPDDDGPGWKSATIRPRAAGPITWARGEIDTAAGRYSVDWSKEDVKFILKLTIPPGAAAMVHIPARSPETVKETTQPANAPKFMKMQDGAAVFKLGAGTYRFESE
jgi:alpha-L-rhamnosidase